MKQFFYIICILILCCTSCKKVSKDIIVKGNVLYDFTLADLSIKYIQTGDSSIISDIVKTEGLKLLYNHATWTGNNSRNLSLEDFAITIIDRENKRIYIDSINRNLQYAKDSIALIDYPQTICLQYLPEGYSFSSRLCFTVGYDLGIVYLNNASVNLSHQHYLQNCSELKYYSIHELHHAAFVDLKNNYMPSLKINTYGEMAQLIAYFTHLEGMAVYAAYDERVKGHSINSDPDYIALEDTTLKKKYCSRYFEIYNHFLSNPNDTLTQKDWMMIGELSSNDRLWYRVGASMAEGIDKKFGRNGLTNLIGEPSENFIKTYLLVNNNYSLNCIQ
jgi:hypothetical protein